MLTRYLRKFLESESLNERDMENALESLINVDVPVAQAGAFLGMLQMKKASSSELIGGARFLRRHATFIDCGSKNAVDIVGTGGDGANTFNISTTSAFVAAGAGLTIAKHGNRAATSKCGSADVLANLGYNLDATAAVIEESIRENGIGFMFAPKLHNAMAKVKFLRTDLNIKTIFNLLGPLANPAGAKTILLGVYSPQLTELFAEVLLKLGTKRALVVYGFDGIDEISCSMPTRYSEIKNGVIKTGEIIPELILNNSYDFEDLKGGSPAENAEILMNILTGKEQGAKRAVVTINAGAAIYLGGLADSISDGVKLAEQSIDSGAALQKLNFLVESSHA